MLTLYFTVDMPKVKSAISGKSAGGEAKLVCYNIFFFYVLNKFSWYSSPKISICAGFPTVCYPQGSSKRPRVRLNRAEALYSRTNNLSLKFTWTVMFQLHNKTFLNGFIYSVWENIWGFMHVTKYDIISLLLSAAQHPIPKELLYTVIRLFSGY